MKKTLSFLLALALALGFSATTATAATPETVTDGTVSISNVVLTKTASDGAPYYYCYEPTITIDEDILWVNCYYYYNDDWADVYFDTSYSSSPFFDTSNTTVTMTDTNKSYSMEGYLSACQAGSIDYFNAPTTIVAGSSFDILVDGTYIFEIIKLDGSYTNVGLLIYSEDVAIAYADEVTGESDATAEETPTEETEEPADTTFTATTPETMTDGSLSISNVVLTETASNGASYYYCYEPTITVKEDIYWVNFDYYNNGTWTDVTFFTSYSGSPLFDTSNTTITMTNTNENYSMEGYLAAATAGSIDYFNDPTTIVAGSSFDILIDGAYYFEVVGLDGSTTNLSLLIYPEAQAIAYADMVAKETQIVTGTATATNGTVLVNGEEVSFESYNIDGSNYFMLRDLAAAFTGTDKEFEVTYNTETKAIDLVSGEAYTAVGGELTLGDGTAKTYKTTSSDIFKDGELAEFEAYLIDGNNYFKLRDVCQAFDIGVTWDDDTNTIALDTTLSYED